MIAITAFGCDMSGAQIQLFFSLSVLWETVESKNVNEKWHNSYSKVGPRRTL